MIELRPYQDKILNDVRQSFANGHKKPCVVSPTASGKTIMFSSIAENAIKKNNDIMILVHRQEILQQTLSKLYMFGIQSGQIISGRNQTRDMCQVAMITTLANRLGKVKPPKMLIVDECHHAVSPTWKKVIDFFNVPTIGFTATPERLSGEGLNLIFDDLILGPSISELVSEGYLSYPLIYRTPDEIDFKFHIKQGDFDRDEQEKAYTKKQIIGDVISHYKKYMNYKPAVCFCVSVKHSEIMADVFRQAGYVAVCVYGGMKKEDREMALNGLKNGSVHIVTSCDVISEGVDVEVLAGVILLRKTMSLALYLQWVGRALRKYPGKENAIILDHAGNYHLHGHVLAEREWSLNAVKRSKRKNIPLKTTSCPECFAVWPGQPQKCPDCGFVFSINKTVAEQQRKTPEQIEGELIAALPANIDKSNIKELSEFVNRLQSMDGRKRQKAMLAKSFEMSKVENYDEFRKIMKPLSEAIGYKAGWTHYTWKNILKKA